MKNVSVNFTKWTTVAAIALFGLLVGNGWGCASG